MTSGSDFWSKVFGTTLPFLLLLAGCAHVREPEGMERYLIKFSDWTPTVGQQWTNAFKTLESIQNIRTLPDSKEETNTSVSVDFRANYLIVSLDTNSRSAEINFTVERLESVTGGRTNLLLSDGEVVNAKFLLGERFFTCNSGLLPLAAQRALEKVIAPIPTGSEFSDPDGHISGLDQPRVIGESWTVTDRKVKQQLLYSMRELGRDLSADDLALRFQFVGLTNVMETDCFHLRLTIAVDSPALPPKFRPPPFFRWSKRSTSFLGTLEFVFPRDGFRKMRWSRLSGEMRMKAIATGPGGEATLVIQGQTERSVFVQLLQDVDDGTQ